MLKYFPFFLACLFLFSCNNSAQYSKPLVLRGSDVLITDSLKLIHNKNIAVVCNHTSRLQNSLHILDSLVKINDVNIEKIFSPEHGFKGNAAAGIKVNDTAHADANIQIVSLYGKKKKLDSSDLENIDVVLFDIQDIGVRYYTYISTLYYVIEACGENDIPLIILDRPNPLGGVNISGPVTDHDFISFISIAPIPIIHGLTTGELALLFNNEFIDKNKRAEITVVKMKNWKRDLVWDDFEENWLPPSPNIPDFETALIYPATCYFEGINISEGRGTFQPFRQIGAPFINSLELISELKTYPIEGVEIFPVVFTPQEIKGMASDPKYKGKSCNGIKFSVTDRKKFNPVKTGLQLLSAVLKLYGDKIVFREKHFDLLWGSEKVRKNLLDKVNFEKILHSFAEPVEKYKSLRKKYLLYN